MRDAYARALAHQPQNITDWKEHCNLGACADPVGALLVISEFVFRDINLRVLLFAGLSFLIFAP